MNFTKGKDYYRSLDKRTKEYREYRDYVSKQVNGLGDLIEKGLNEIGITQSKLQKLGFDDCGCDERKEALNKAFRFTRAKCLEEDEFIWLSIYFDRKTSRVSIDEQREMVKIYNRVFNERQTITDCSSCVKKIVLRLQKMTEIHKK